MSKNQHVWALPAALAAGLVVAACGGGSSGSGYVPPGYYTSSPAPSSAGAAPGSPSPTSSSSAASKYLSVDAATSSVTLTLDAAAPGTSSQYNFDGYSSGKMTVTVPQGWKVTVNCTNQGSIPHSCAIVSGASSTSPAFPGASTPNPTVGLQPGQSASFTFTPGTVGTYRIACLVPGHEDIGMWDVFKVVASGQPSITTS